MVETGLQTLVDQLLHHSQGQRRHLSQLCSQGLGSREWPFKIQITSLERDGSLTGELTWLTLSSVHRIRGTLIGGALEFVEVEAIRRGGAHLNVAYTLTVTQAGATGSWVDRGDGSKGTVRIGP